MGRYARSRMLRVIPLILVSLDLAASAQLNFQVTGPLILRGGEGAVEIPLTSPGKGLNQQPASLTDKTSRAKLTAPKATCVLNAGAASLPAKIEPIQAIQIKSKFLLRFCRLVFYRGAPCYLHDKWSLLVAAVRIENLVRIS